jgi:hypothetical protein
MEKAMNSYHQFDCRQSRESNQRNSVFEFLIRFFVHCLTVFDWNVMELDKFVKAIEKNPKTVFDFDFSDRDDPMYEKNMLGVSLAKTLKAPVLHQLTSYSIFQQLSTYAKQHRKLKVLMDSHAKLFESLMIKKYTEFVTQPQPEVWFSKSVNIKRCSIDEGFVQKHKLKQESSTILSESIGTAHHPSNSMLRMSCATNTQGIFVSDKLVTYVCKPIKAGSEIFRSALFTFEDFGPAAQRKAKYVFFEYHCDCEACINDCPTTERMRRTDPSFQFSDVRAFAPNNQAKKNIARNNAYIDHHSKEHEPTQEVYITIINNHKELSGLARPSFYP